MPPASHGLTRMSRKTPSTGPGLWRPNANCRCVKPAVLAVMRSTPRQVLFDPSIGRPRHCLPRSRGIARRRISWDFNASMWIMPPRITGRMIQPTRAAKTALRRRTLPLTSRPIEGLSQAIDACYEHNKCQPPKCLRSKWCGLIDARGSSHPCRIPWRRASSPQSWSGVCSGAASRTTREVARPRKGARAAMNRSICTMPSRRTQPGSSTKRAE
jgi:hypothetical protein